MSHSPTSPADRDSLLAYRDAWQATNRLLRQGHSFSGFEPNCVYLNCRGSRFANVSSVTGLDFPDDGRALGVTDWDQDGDLDVWMGNRTGPRLRLMRNSTIDGSRHHTDHGYVAFRLRGTESNRDAIGARVTVELAPRAGSSPSPASPKLIQTLRAGDAFLSQSSKWLHFGLGSDTDVAKVEVRWPSGTRGKFFQHPCRAALSSSSNAAVRRYCCRPQRERLRSCHGVKNRPLRRRSAAPIFPTECPCRWLPTSRSTSTRSKRLTSPAARS